MSDKSRTGLLALIAALLALNIVVSVARPPVQPTPLYLPMPVPVAADGIVDIAPQQSLIATVGNDGATLYVWKRSTTRGGEYEATRYEFVGARSRAATP